MLSRVSRCSVLLLLSPQRSSIGLRFRMFGMSRDNPSPTPAHSATPPQSLPLPCQPTRRLVVLLQRLLRVPPDMPSVAARVPPIAPARPDAERTQVAIYGSPVAGSVSPPVFNHIFPLM